jgi:protein SCO1/2
MRKFLVIVTLLLLIVTSALLWLTEGAPTSSDTQNTADTGAGEALIGGSYTLTDHNGNTVTDQSFLGKPSLVFFGFTSCPDICPTAAATMTAAMAKLGDKAEQVTPLFITIDTARDTPEVLKNYLSSFDKHFVGLTGTGAQVQQAAAAFKVYYAKASGGDEMGFDHSGFIYLMDANGKYVTHFANTAAPDEIAAALKPYLH